MSGNYYLVVGGGGDGGRDGGVERCEKWICQINCIVREVSISLSILFQCLLCSCVFKCIEIIGV